LLSKKPLNTENSKGRRKVPKGIPALLLIPVHSLFSHISVMEKRAGVRREPNTPAVKGLVRVTFVSEHRLIFSERLLVLLVQRLQFG
jgi:hypothetical protein